jgi:glycosyltransferase involved in cell wall biosynthesis
MRERVLLIHNRYQQRGGEDVVLETEAAMLARRGHDVLTLEFDNSDIPDRRSPLDTARLAAATIWSPRAARRVRRAVRSFRPDIVHFHNTFPLISPAAYAACRAEAVPVVQTLHNFRLLCPNAEFYREGRPCQDCLGRTPPWPGVFHACYRGSRPQTAVVAAMLTTHRVRRTWQRDVDLFISLTEFSRRAFSHGGLDPARIAVKPNFVASDPGIKSGVGDYFLFVGRLTESKGVATLLDAWRQTANPVPLHIVGDGPLDATVARTAVDHPSVRVLGPQIRQAVVAQMHGARALIFPSVWFETFGLAIAEAFACGLPVIASRLGAMAEIVDDGRTGLLVRPGDAMDLAAKIAWAWQHPAEMQRMGMAARNEYEARYTEADNYRQLHAIYERARDLRTG